MASSAVMGDAMAKADKPHGGKRKGAGRPAAARDDVPVRLDRETASTIMFVARDMGMTMGDYIVKAIHKTLMKDFEAMAAKRLAKPAEGSGEGR